MSRRRRLVSAAAVATTVALLTPGAAVAAQDGGTGDANALRATIAGNTQGTGTVIANNDGTGQEKSGPSNPPVSVLTGQPYVNLGVLAQDALARDNGTSAACAGVAGDGGSVVEIGDSGCLEPGESINLTLSGFDVETLLDVELAAGTGSLGTAFDALGVIPVETFNDVLDALQNGVDTVAADFDPRLEVDAGAVQSSCTADGSRATGSTSIANGALVVNLGFGAPKLLDLDAEPDPNTRLLSDLGPLVDVMQQAISDQIDSNLAPLSLDPNDQTNLIIGVLEQLEPAFNALEENVVEVILNQQEKSQGGRRIDVTGLSVRLLPAAEAAGAPTPLAQAEIANVGCGPLAAAATDSGGNPVPTTVNAGADQAPGSSGDHSAVAALLASLLALAGAAGLLRLAMRD